MKKASKGYRQSIVKLSYGMSAKMLNVLSLSTSCKNNSRCMSRAKDMAGIKELKKIAEKTGKPICICRACFAVKTINARSTVAGAMNYNSEVLTNRVLTIMEVKVIALEIVVALIKNNTHKFRLESFGDIANIAHATNYINICAAITKAAKIYNYVVNIAWWTKNSDILMDAWTMADKRTQKAARKNLTILISSVFVGIPASEKERLKVKEITKARVMVFTVHFEDNGHITCGARCCDTCGRCYDRKVKNMYVDELIK